MKATPTAPLRALVVLAALAASCQQPEGAAKAVSVPTAGPSRTVSESGYDISPLAKTDAEWRRELTAEQFQITRRADTEPAFSGEYWDNKRAGVYVSRCGGLPLFSSEDKFDSGTGWPSFTRPLDQDHILERVDTAHGWTRTEILDARSGAHLGHVFDDGPAPTGKRYCLNSAALRFVPSGTELPEESRRVVPGSGK